MQKVGRSLHLVACFVLTVRPEVSPRLGVLQVDGRVALGKGLMEGVGWNSCHARRRGGGFV